MRSLYLVFGYLSLALAIIGLFVPLLPTTPFVLLSAYCFQKSSPRIHTWLIEQPTLGPILKDWTENRIIRRRTKGVALTLLWITLAWPLSQPHLPIWAKIGASIVGLAVSVFILRQKSDGHRKSTDAS